MFARFVVALFAVFAVAGARAMSTVSPTGGVSVLYGAASIGLADGAAFDRFLTRAVGGTTSPAGAAVMETYGLDVGGSRIVATATRAITLGEVAGAAALLGGAAWTGFNVGAPISKALGHDTLEIGDTKCTATYSMGWVCGEKQDPSVGGGTAAGIRVALSWGMGTTFYGSTEVEACAAAMNAQPAPTAPYTYRDNYNPDSPWTFSSTPGVRTPGSSCMVRKCVSAGSNCTAYPGFPAGLEPTQIASAAKCPASVDALNPAWSVPEGSPPGADGKCPTGRYNSASTATINAVIAANLAAHPELAPSLVIDTLAKGQPIPVAAPRTLSGPATSTKPATTTTTTTGTGTTTATGTQTINYSYAGDTITYNISNVTTTTYPDGSTEVKTDDKPPDDPCGKAPDTVGCSKLGDVPTDAPKWTEKPVTYAAEDLGIAGACPVPWTFSVGGTSFSPGGAAGWQPLCDIAPQFRAFVLALTGFGCLFTIVTQTTRT